MSESIYVKDLTKRFETVEAVSGVSFSARQGELFGFLGPNGAGKTHHHQHADGFGAPGFGGHPDGQGGATDPADPGETCHADRPSEPLPENMQEKLADAFSEFTVTLTDEWTIELCGGFQERPHPVNNLFSLDFWWKIVLL